MYRGMWGVGEDREIIPFEVGGRMLRASDDAYGTLAVVIDCDGSCIDLTWEAVVLLIPSLRKMHLTLRTLVLLRDSQIAHKPVGARAYATWWTLSPATVEMMVETYTRYRSFPIVAESM